MTVWGWIKDTQCEGRGVYLDYLLAQRRTKDGWEYPARWYLGEKDVNGCNNGRESLQKLDYTASGDPKVPYVRLTICSREDGSADGQVCYSLVFNNPYIDG